MNDTAQILSIVRRLEQDSKRMKEEMAHMRQELFKNSNKAVWVTAKDIIEKTGWTCKDIERHRKEQTIEFKYLMKGEAGKKSSIRYNLNSIPEQFIKKL